jgi:hypothetical protein
MAAPKNYLVTFDSDLGWVSTKEMGTAESTTRTVGVVAKSAADAKAKAKILVGGKG